MQFLACRPSRAIHLGGQYHQACTPEIGRMICANIDKRSMDCVLVLFVALYEAKVLTAQHFEI